MPWVNTVSAITDEDGDVLLNEDGLAYVSLIGSVFEDTPPARALQVGTDSRLLDQYKGSPKLVALLKALIDTPYQELSAALGQLRGRLDIDTMSGLQLDGIGQILGQPRPQVLDFAEAGQAFEFIEDGMAGTVWDDTGTWDDAGTWVDGSDPNKAFSSLDAPDQGGRFAGLATNQLMGDADYRVLLRARILANTTAATIPDLEAYGTAVLGVPVRVVNGLGQISITVTGRLSPVIRGVFQETIQAAAGVGIIDFVYGVAADAFTFDGPGGTGFGATDQPKSGSGFARLLQSN